MKPQPGLREAACPAGLAPHLPLTSAFSPHAGLWVPVQPGGPSQGTSRKWDMAWHSGLLRRKDKSKALVVGGDSVSNLLSFTGGGGETETSLG